MSVERASNPAVGTMTCPSHRELMAEVIELRRAGENRDREHGEIMGVLATQGRQIQALDKRIDTLSEQHGTLATSMASSASIARTGGLLAGGGGGLMGLIEIGRWAGHAMGWW